MDKVGIRYKKMHNGVKTPSYATPFSSGADVSAFLEEDVVIKKGERALIPTGLVLEIPPSYEVQVRPRSGLALKYGITVLNSPGTIDQDYRGEVKIILINTGCEDFTIKNGDRIAQLVLSPVVFAEYVEGEVEKTERNDKGFGSSGV